MIVHRVVSAVMKLHNSTANIGDSVYDLVNTFGSITRVGESSITVQFTNGTQLAYDANGVQVGKGRATLYWHDPMLMIPPKDMSLWAKQKRALTAVLNYFNEAV